MFMAAKDAGTYRWLVLASASKAAAEQAVRAAGIDPVLVLAKGDVVASPRRVRRLARESRVNAIALHVPERRRLLNPQLYDYIFAVVPAKIRVILEDSRAGPVAVGRWQSLFRTIVAPGATLWVATEIALAIARSHLNGRKATSPRPRRSVTKAAVLIWPGGGSSVGGSVTHMAGMVKGLQQCGYRVGLVSTEPAPPQFEIADDLELIGTPRRGRLTSDVESVVFNRYLDRAVNNLAERLEPDFMYQRHRVFLYIGASIARGLGIPFVLEWNASEVWTRENWGPRTPFDRTLDDFAVRAERLALAGASVVAAVSTEAAQMALRAGADPATVVVIPNGVDVQAVQQEVARDNGQTGGTTIGWIGSFGPWHGADILVRALQKLPEVTLVMIGDGPELQRCKQLAAELDLAGRIEWTGSLPHDLAVRTLARCDLLASPHLPTEGASFFGSPTKLFEYMAIGKPIVASNLGQIGEVLQHEVTAELVTPGDVDALARAMEKVLAMPDRGRALGVRALDTARRQHSWEQRAALLLDALAESKSDRRFPASTAA